MELLHSDKLQRGFSTILIVILLGSMCLGLVLWISTTTFWALKSTTGDELAAVARSLVNSCAEQALEKIRQNKNDTTPGSFTIDDATCNYTITNSGGNTRSIEVVGTVQTITKKLQITTTSFNPIVINSWQEVE